MSPRWRRFGSFGVGTNARRLFASSPDRRSASPRRDLTEDARSRSILAARAAAAKSGADTLVLDVGPIIGITEVFVITSGRNTRQVRTIAEEIEKKLKDEGHSGPVRTEGLRDATWVLLDYGDFVAHVFLEETRGYYNLDRLWADAPRLAWEDSAAAVS
ncbi:MAG TPA: ribosome silencing factor [Acidimicrobiia bacterium]|nr:ribosome silencing factor [Acidimicrobiia bacterium]